MKGKIAFEEHMSLEETLEDSRSFAGGSGKWDEFARQILDLDEERLAGMERNGIDFTIFQGTGKDAEDNSKVGFEIFLFSPKKGKLGIFYCQYSDEADAKVIQSLIKIVESIRLTTK